MNPRIAVIAFAVVVISGHFIHSATGMDACEFEEKFPESSNSCHKKQVSSTKCPRNMVYEKCTCRGTCEEPSGSSGCHSKCNAGAEGCTCPEGFLMNGEDCVSPSDCPCYWPEVHQIIPKNQSKVNDDCTERRTCINNQLVSDVGYKMCSPNAQCLTQDGERQCKCKDGFKGDGQTCEALYTDCYDAYTAGHRQDGLYPIKPLEWNAPAFTVPCVMTADGGGWTVFQRRTGVDRRVNFYRNWTSYRDGFGSLSGDFWLGNEKLHYLTKQKRYKLRVDMLGSRNSSLYAEWSTFRVGPEEHKYRLSADGYSGNTSSQNLLHHNGQAFSTYDQDNDGCERHHCAERHRGGWWYHAYYCAHTYSSRCYTFPYQNEYARCTYSNLNGDYSGSVGENIFWYSYPRTDYCYLNYAEMKVRPSN